MSDWMKLKAADLLAEQVGGVLARSQYPEPELARGMVEALYAVGLLDDVAHGYWTQRIGDTVHERRAVLAEERIQRILAEGPQKVRRTA